MDQLAPVLAMIAPLYWAGFAVFIRIGAMMAVLPGFGDQTVPLRVRLVLAIMFTAIVAPAVELHFDPVPGGLITALRDLAPEVAVGLFFGLLLRFFVLALQIAAAIAAQSTSLAQIFGGASGVDPQPAIGHLLVVAGTALAALTGLHVQAAAYMIHSYTLVPFGAGLAPQWVAQAGLAQIARIFSLAFSLAAPFLIAALIYNLVLGVINRAMPQLMVSFVGAPALTAGGLVMLVLAAPVMLALWLAGFTAFLQDPFGGLP